MSSLKNFIYPEPAVGKPCQLIRGNPFYENCICSLLMANTTTFNDIKWKLSLPEVLMS